MEILKRSDRLIKTSTMINMANASGASVTEIEEFMKWKEIGSGSRISIKFTIYEIANVAGKCYFISDSLDMVASKVVPSLEECLSLFRSNGYQTATEFHIQNDGIAESDSEE